MKIFLFLKNTIFVKKTFMSFSVVHQLTVWLPSTVLYIAYASFIWWTTNHSLTTIWKFSFKNGMKSRESFKISFQLECVFEITTSISNCWSSIPRTATLSTFYQNNLPLFNFDDKDTINCPEKLMKISHFNQTNQRLLSILW